MRRLLVAALTTVLALAVTLMGCAKTPAGPSGAARATIGLSYIPDIQFAPFYVAQSHGLFAGVDTTLRHHGASEGLFTALMAGQEDFVLAGGDEAVQARAQGMDLVAVGQYYRSYPVVIIVPDTSDNVNNTDAAVQRHRQAQSSELGCSDDHSTDSQRKYDIAV